MQRHADWMLRNGCSGLVMLGSLGEGATLEREEKIAILRNIAGSIHGRAPVVAAISSLSTAAAVRLAKEAEQAGCDGLMVLPPYVYSSDWREMRAHVSAILAATPLSCMLYNNPIAYGTDFLPEQIADLAVSHETLHAVKESSADLRRITAIRSLLGNRLAILVSGNSKEAFELYRWFLPLLRMDTVPKFVQLIKWVQEEVNVGAARVRPPRLQLEGDELLDAQKKLQQALATRPRIATIDFANSVGASA
jgi:4-hydroxy-tetrahydrodipicolinate synthase